MRIGDRTQALALGPFVAARPLRHADKEALVGRQAVRGLKVLPFGGFFPRQKRQPRAAEIGQILAQR